MHNQNKSKAGSAHLGQDLSSLQTFTQSLIDKQAHKKWFTTNEETLFNLIQWFKMQFSKKIKIYWSEIVLNSTIEDDGSININVDDDMINIKTNSAQWHQVVDFINLLVDFKKAIDHH